MGASVDQHSALELSSERGKKANKILLSEIIFEFFSL